MSNIIIDSFRFGSDSPVTPSLGYGLLYNWYAATDARGVAPSGFQVPTLTQLQTLQTFLGGESVAGGKLKSIRSVLDGDPYWDAPNTGATNEFDFNLFPSGIRFTDGTYSTAKQRCEFQAQTVGGYSLGAYYNSNNLQVLGGFFGHTAGFSIRCVSDTEPSTTLVQDADGNSYTWVQIGEQYWLAQSLRTTKYNNGDSIVTGLDNAAWAATTDGAWAYPNGDSSLPI